MKFEGLWAAAVCGALTVFVSLSAARAVPFNPADFSVVEGPGVYTVINNSTDWYV